MRTSYKLLLLFLLLLLLGSAAFVFFNNSLPTGAGNSNLPQETISRLCTPFHPGSRYNDAIAFYVDLQVHSGRYRFYVLDLKQKRLLHRGMVLNGREVDGQPIYSNIPGSKCSSRGLAKVGYAYRGRFGKAYKLAGLEAHNSNMMARAVVLHSWRGVPNMQVPFRLPNSEGCPAVSPKFMKILESSIDNSNKPILMYIN